MIARLTCSLITIVMLTAACGADRSDVVGDDLAVAQQEIARLEALLVEQPEAVSTEEPVIREVSGSPYSVGPCGVFALNGTRIMELSYEVDEDGFLDCYFGNNPCPGPFIVMLSSEIFSPLFIKDFTKMLFL